MPAAKPKSARELAARALCRHDGNPEDTMFEGRPMWESYLPAADAALAAIGWKDVEPDAAADDVTWAGEVPEMD